MNLRPVVTALLLGALVSTLGGCAGVHGPGLGLETTSSGFDMGAQAGLLQVRHHGDARAALWAVVVFMLVVVVIVDLVILPFSYHRRHLFFPCCRACIRICR